VNKIMETIDNENLKAKLTETIKKLVGFMDLECQVEIKEETDDKNSKAFLVSIYTPENAKFLIGKNGQNLQSLEQILRSMFLKKTEGINSIVVDVNDYRKAHSMYIADVARQAVARVRSTQKAEVLSPMSGFERRIVHMELASCPDITTESIGADPNRRIVVKPFI
jgi:spoIIIJ-associated protein